MLPVDGRPGPSRHRRNCLHLRHLDHIRDTRITFVGHATTLVEMSGVRILTDPLFRDRFRLLKRRVGLRAGSIDVDSLDAVVLSHMHFDHMDYPSLRMIPKHVPIIAPEGAARYLEREVLHDVAEMRVGESMRIGGVEIHATPALHGSGFYWPMWFPRTVLSFMIEGTHTVFFVGDSSLFDSMKELGESFDIDVALLPVWGYGPWLRGDHMDPAQAASALGLLKPRVAVPIHWGTLHPIGSWWRRMAFLHHPPRTFALEATLRAPRTEVRVLMPGESTLVGPVVSYERRVPSFADFPAVAEPVLA